MAVLVFAVHLPFLPPTLGDLDSINFALGVRDFDVARHQPHPPGYPVYIALAKASTSAFHAAGLPAPDVRGLAIWSALAGGALVLLLFAFYRTIDGRDRVAAWATAVAVACPLVWFSALRPLSDMTGLAVMVAAQALMMSVIFSGDGARWTAGSRLAAAAFLAGIAVGIRAQSFVLTLPLLAYAALLPASPLSWRSRALAPLGFAAGALVWGIPLLVSSGGLGAYLSALGAQGAEDFGGVPILWTLRTKQVLRESLLNTYVWPWGEAVVAVPVLVFAAAGVVRAAWRAPRLVVALAMAFGPYAIFHPLFHDVPNSRNALPLVVPVAYLFAAGLEGLTRHALAIGAATVAAASLVLAVPASAAYAREGSPTFRMLADAGRQSDSIDAFGMHAVFRRAADWAPPVPEDRLLRAPHGTEWLRLVERWRANPAARIRFAADPRHTDLALFDPTARRLERSYRWPFREQPYVGGARPGDADLYLMSPPGWMLDQGWALTAEIGGVSARQTRGPHLQPSIAWVRARDAEATMLIGGRNLQAPPMRMTVAVNGASVDSWDVPAGFFVRRIEIPRGALAGAGYVSVGVRADPAGAAASPVSLEQFDLQPAGVPMMAFEDGWQEPEYNLLDAKAWRWMADRAVLWLRPVGRDVTLRFAGESPLRYYDAPPALRVAVGDVVISEIRPSDAFAHEVKVPGDALARAGGRVVVTSDKHFVPGDRDGTADHRRLAVRIYTVEVR